MRKVRFDRPLLFFICIASGFLVLKLITLSPRISDENLYFYASLLLTRGILPYRDYFIGQLPTQIILNAILLKLFGVNLIVLKIVPLVATIATSALLLRMFTERRNPRGGMLVTALFLGSFVVIGTTDFAYGVHMATLLLVFSWYLLERSPFWAGLVLCVGLTYRLYILPAALGFAAYELVRGNWRRVAVFLGSSLVPFVVVNLVLFFLFGEPFTTAVWRYHMIKLAVPGDPLTFPIFIRNDILPLMFAAAAVWTLVKTRVGRIRKGEVVRIEPSTVNLGLSAASAAAAQLLFLLLLSLVFQFYFVTLMPFLTLLASIALGALLPRRSQRFALPVVLAFALLSAITYLRGPSKMASFDHWEDAVRDVQRLAREDETIFGTYLVTSLLAVLSDRDVTEMEIDTNFQRHLAGLFSSEEATRVATASAVVIEQANIDELTGTLTDFEPFYIDQRTLAESCRLYKTYPVKHEPRFNALVLWDCTSSAGQSEYPGRVD